MQLCYESLRASASARTRMRVVPADAAVACDAPAGERCCARSGQVDTLAQCQCHRGANVSHRSGGDHQRNHHRKWYARRLGRAVVDRQQQDASPPALAAPPWGVIRPAPGFPDAERSCVVQEASAAVACQHRRTTKDFNYPLQPCQAVHCTLLVSSMACRARQIVAKLKRVPTVATNMSRTSSR